MSELERGRGVALWSQIGDIIATDIVKGRLRQGEMLPSAQDLAARFSVNRHTVRRAMADLEKRNLVRTERGRGSFVQEQMLDYAISLRTRFNQNMRNLNVDNDIEILKTVREIPPIPVSEALGLGRNEYTFRIDTLGHADGHVVDHCTAYFPAARFPGLPEVYRRTRSVTATLSEFGVTDYMRKHTRVSARLPEALTARLLKQQASRPVLHVQSINADTRGVPVQYGITRFSGDWVQLVLMAGD